MEKLATSPVITLSETVLGSAVVLLAVLLFVILKLVFAHMKESDERWTKTVDKNTDALNEMAKSQTESLKGLAKSQTESGDKIAISIERALLYKSVSNSNSNDGNDGMR